MLFAPMLIDELGGYVDAAALGCAGSSAGCAARRAIEQVENDLLVAVLIQVESDLFGILVLLVGHADGDLLSAIPGVTDSDRDLLTRSSVAQIQYDFRSARSA